VICFHMLSMHWTPRRTADSFQAERPPSVQTRLIRLEFDPETLLRSRNQQPALRAA